MSRELGLYNPRLSNTSYRQSYRNAQKRGPCRHWAVTIFLSNEALSDDTIDT